MSQDVTTLLIFDAKNVKYAGKLLVRPITFVAPNEVFYIFYISYFLSSMTRWSLF